MVAINTPYVKQFENGVLINPIDDAYKSEGQNRRVRRAKDGRHLNNRSTVQMVCSGGVKYRKSIQRVPLFEKITKGIYKLIGYKNIYHSVAV